MRLLPLLLCKSLIFQRRNDHQFRNTLDAALAGVEDIGLSRSLVRRLAHLDEYLMQYVFVFESFLDTNELAYEIYTYAATKVRLDFCTGEFPRSKVSFTLCYVKGKWAW